MRPVKHSVAVLAKILPQGLHRIRVQHGPFRGALLFCRIGNSKRKLLGLYEHVLNEWIARTVPRKQFAFDVGANTGFNTFGFAQLLKTSPYAHTCVVAFEPNAKDLPELTVPLDWPEYRNSDICLLSKFVGVTTTNAHITLDDAFSMYRDKLTGPGIIKIDIEGDEVNALRGASELLKNPACDWLIEVHGKELIVPVAAFFTKRQRPFLLKELTPLPFIGPENRAVNTYWLMTI